MRLGLVLERGDEDNELPRPEEGPYLSGGGDTDLICVHCDLTLIRGIRREDVCAVLMSYINPMRAAKGIEIPNRGTAVENRPFPLVARCRDCGALNRIWPIIPA